MVTRCGGSVVQRWCVDQEGGLFHLINLVNFIHLAFLVSSRRHRHVGPFHLVCAGEGCHMCIRSVLYGYFIQLTR